MNDLPCGSGSSGNGKDWSAEHVAVHIETLVDSSGQARTSMLRHPDYPFVGWVAEDGGWGDNDPQRRRDPLENGLRALALSYLQRLKDRLGFDDVINWLGSQSGPDGFGWLELRWGLDVPAEEADPRLSFWVERVDTRDDLGKPLDRSVVLLAGNRVHEEGSEQIALGYGVGLRIVMHAKQAAPGDPWQVRITGASFADLHLAIAPTQPPPPELSNVRLTGLLDDMRVMFGFARSNSSVSLDGAWWSSDGEFRLTGTGKLADDAGGRVYAWGTRGSTADKHTRLRRDFLVEVMTHATQPIKVFNNDPASCGPAHSARRRRPTRQADPLDTYRKTTNRLPADEVLPPPHKRLADPRARFEVRQSRLGHHHGDPGEVQVIASKKLALRSDQLAAAHAYVRGEEFFDRLDAYGLPPRLYFKLARLPLLLRHRAPLNGANDGMAVNAQVGPEDPGINLLLLRGELLLRPRIQVLFGAASLSHRDLLPNDDGEARLQYLGLAADERWAWHEFGHVLAFACTGRLEHLFAHSAGDGLAAIVADPGSRLGRDAAPRGHTFPWARINRRHDRNPALGWCWCGRRNTRRLLPPSNKPFAYGGYFAEQLLSTSLFRLYRAIGGDTLGAGGSATPEMHSASDYVVYLVMRAIALLGPHAVTPARSADQFVGALIDADIGTRLWNINARWPDAASRPTERVGGMLHKVIRWAFERQGLDAVDEPEQTFTGEGRPPKVDIYIPGLGPRTVGGYEPVALPTLNDERTHQAWHASAAAIAVAADGIRVTVGNRGRETADQVEIEVWVSPAGQPRLLQKLDAAEPAQASIPPGGWTQAFVLPASVGHAALAPGRYVALAVATCTGDRADSDSAGGLPCAWAAAPPADDRLLTDLVANDNNIGLRIITLPA
jgi:hypothetical protein